MIVMSFLKYILAQLDAALSYASKLGMSEDFLRFGIVGASGFCWDTATVYALRHSLGLYIAGAIGFFVAASANWALNRFWTFRYKTHDSIKRQWPIFMLTNSIGFIFNRGCFFILISAYYIFYHYPVLAIIVGSFAGMGFNYFLSKRFVFR